MNDFTSEYLQRKFSVKGKKGIYGYPQEVADQICQYLGDYKEFGLWVKKAKEIGAGQLEAKLKYIREKGIKSSRYLLACCKIK